MKNYRIQLQGKTTTNVDEEDISNNNKIITENAHNMWYEVVNILNNVDIVAVFIEENIENLNPIFLVLYWNITMV